MTGTVELDITAIAAGGAGVGRHDGLVVFVPRTAPGDRARVELRAKGRFAEGRLVEILHPSAARVTPACVHYERDRCGGCQLQHLSMPAQHEAKRGIVRDALVRIGKREVEPPDVRASPAAWRYRNKLTLALRRRGQQWIAGLHPYDAPGRVFALEDCPITAAGVLAVWRDILAASRWLPDEPSLRGAVRLDGDTASFVLEGGSRWPHAATLFEATPALGSLWWVPEGGSRKRLHTRGGAGSPAFAQVNPRVATMVRDHVLERAARHQPGTIIDAYAGDGVLADALARRGASVTTIELDPDAVAAARARHAPRVRIVEGRVEEYLERALPAELVVLNPPRTGLDERVPPVLERAAAEQLARPASRLPRPAVLYVSCNPATLARDVARMPTYRIASLVAFDMFPQTAHVETVCELLPEAA